MQQRVITIVLLLGLCFSLTLLVSATSRWHAPDNHQGYAPEQPIAYSHRLHAGELQIDCKFCHSASASSRYAGIPASDVCMKCHQYITASFAAMQQELRLADEEKQKPKKVISSELRKLYQSLALDDELNPIAGETPQSLPWVRVHNLPDFARFSHQAHVAVGVSCQHCHGPIASMERVRQHAPLSMGWCVNCHRESTRDGVDGREVNASTDCTVCHH